MRQYWVHTPAPSTIAASRISCGRVRMKLARTKTQKPIWKPMWTTMTAQYESNIVIESDIQYGSGMRLNSTYSGVTMTCWGSRFPAVNSISSRMPPRSFSRETAKATNDAKKSVTSTPGTAMISVLTKYFVMPESLKACL